MKKRDSTCLAERGVAASSLLKPLATAVGRQSWYRVAAGIGSVGLALLAWQFTGSPAAGSNAQIPVATMEPALARTLKVSPCQRCIFLPGSGCCKTVNLARALAAGSLTIQPEAPFVLVPLMTPARLKTFNQV